ncbi:MAG TPA: NADP-dependent oxidoreductase [Terrimesophilobacter sp.]|nr:NADP-dependent oxidoreductase [Terrimesophilobacter sp.]
MRAMTITATGGTEVFELAEVPVPLQAIGEALVDVAAAGVNPIDAKTRAGRGAAAHIRQFPAVLAGTVNTAAYLGHELHPGTEVYGIVGAPRVSGSYAEKLTAPVVSMARKPRTLSPIEAAALPCAALTAWGAVHDAGQVQPGQRVLVHAGAGGVGHIAVQLAAAAGAHVVATASARNHDWLRSLGAAETIDYRSADFEDETGDIDLVVDLIGNVTADTGRRSLKVMKPGAMIVNVPSGSWPELLGDAAAAGMRATDLKLIPDAHVLQELADRIDAGALTVHVDRVFDLADAAEAHRVLEEGHTRGKLVLRI